MAIDPTVALSLDEPLLDVEQAAILLSVRPSWVRDATRAGRLLELTRFRGHLMTESAQLERMFVDAEGSAVFAGVQA